MAKKKPAINYTSREFSTIKTDLVNYARQYYPDKFRDFTANSFGSLMLDSVAYVGDILSFYLDFQANESFLSTAVDYDNILKLSKQFGYKATLSPSSYGLLTFFILIPASNGAPDFSYAPILKQGSKFKTGGGNIFTLLEDVSFKDENELEVVVGNVDATTGTPVNYAVRARGQAASGELAIQTVEMGEYQKFQKISVSGENITEIVSVMDSSGNPFYEVDYLTQNTIYVPVTNRDKNTDKVPNILKPVAVPRRFIVERSRDEVYLQFGFGSTEEDLSVLDPSRVMLKQHGKTYISDDSFDPSTLLKSKTLGISPSNTVLTIVYRVNSSESTNASIDTIRIVEDAEFHFEAENSLLANQVTTTRGSLEVTNEEAFVGDIPFPSAEEIKQRAFGSYSMQNRMVTKEDFIAAVYNMPPNFGSIKKVNVAQDSDSFNQRNINMYLISEDRTGALIPTNGTIKKNLKTYLSRYKMINDTIDMFDAHIINLSIQFKVAIFNNANKYSALQAAINSVVDYFDNRNGYDIGEPFSLGDIYSVLNNVPDVLDAKDVLVSLETGGNYANSNYNIEIATSQDGTQIFCPADSVFEVKFPSSDIKGIIV
ncbi:MAG: putative baseplate wedge protein [Prokaryotic dsDNA virus sp.]|nr:MAG: putative baseplate wedge protein [Prokaryotic dsDNA virus sp.]|tara:strand:+ start:9470 stop:11263 length:1794 start_codon:yes stop_codon:yes gene_type:complete